MSRLFLLVFVTDPRDQEVYHHAHESPPSILIPLFILAFLSIFSGLIFEYVVPIHKILGSSHEIAGHHELSPWIVPAVSTLAAGGGILLAFLFYIKPVFSVDTMVSTFRPVHTILVEKYGFDEFYLAFFVKPLDLLANFLAKIDYALVDQIGVDGTAWVTERFSRLNAWVDRVIVDGLVDFWGALTQAGGILARKIQTGWVQSYLFLFTLGFGALMAWRLHITLTDIRRLILCVF
jgi:NADH-quinone oxidoreductase subunit L